jgi:hypothetical protein
MVTWAGAVPGLEALREKVLCAEVAIRAVDEEEQAVVPPHQEPVLGRGQDVPVGQELFLFVAAQVAVAAEGVELVQAGPRRRETLAAEARGENLAPAQGEEAPRLQRKPRDALLEVVGLVIFNAQLQPRAGLPAAPRVVEVIAAVVPPPREDLVFTAGALSPDAAEARARRDRQVGERVGSYRQLALRFPVGRTLPKFAARFREQVDAADPRLVVPCLGLGRLHRPPEVPALRLPSRSRQVGQLRLHLADKRGLLPGPGGFVRQRAGYAVRPALGDGEAESAGVSVDELERRFGLEVAEVVYSPDALPEAAEVVGLAGNEIQLASEDVVARAPVTHDVDRRDDNAGSGVDLEVEVDFAVTFGEFEAAGPRRRLRVTAAAVIVDYGQQVARQLSLAERPAGPRGELVPEVLRLGGGDAGEFDFAGRVAVASPDRNGHRGAARRDGCDRVLRLRADIPFRGQRGEQRLQPLPQVGRRGRLAPAEREERLHLSPAQRRGIDDLQGGDVVAGALRDDHARRFRLQGDKLDGDVEVAGAKVQPFHGGDVDASGRGGGEFDFVRRERAVALYRQRARASREGGGD